MKPNCYECRYRGTVPGDAHSCCRHPDLNGVTDDLSDSLINIISSHGQSKIQIVADKFKLQANYHGIKRGWFLWPWSFDPTWLEHCEGFKEHDTTKTTR